ncbi:MAG: MBL fold metallo-hydrolase, partial [Pyrinomonadaceae bacterium]
HLPHCWEAAMLFEETQRTLFCSDLFHQLGDVEARTESDVVGRFSQALASYQNTAYANYMPWSTRTEANIEKLIALRPKTLAAMHGSTFVGDGSQALRDLAVAMKENLG